jgi:hypothetical protein
MKYQKTFREIRREKENANLRSVLLFLAGMLAFYILLGLVGKVAG